MEESLLIKELITKHDFVFLIPIRLIRERHVHMINIFGQFCAIFIFHNWNYSELKLQVRHLLGDRVLIPLENILLVNSNVLCLGGHEPETVEKDAQDCHDGYH